MVSRTNNFGQTFFINLITESNVKLEDALTKKQQHIKTLQNALENTIDQIVKLVAETSNNCEKWWRYLGPSNALNNVVNTRIVLQEEIAKLSPSKNNSNYYTNWFKRLDTEIEKYQNQCNENKPAAKQAYVALQAARDELEKLEQESFALEKQLKVDQEEYSDLLKRYQTRNSVVGGVNETLFRGELELKNLLPSFKNLTF